MNVDEEFSRIVTESTAALDPYFRRCISNLYRVGRLIGASIRENDQDILRSAVVFLHATVEDCLRSIAAAFLPRASEAALNPVPLIGMPSSRAEKFRLGRLSSHRDKTVSEVIALSVEAYLRHVTFGRPSEIVEQFEPLGFQMDALRPHFPLLEAMMQRRHQIVHRADHNCNGELVALEKDDVLKWADAVFQILAMLMAQAGNKEAFDRVEQLIVKIASDRGIQL